jgi:putative PIN family toxin of toxin-antitoxin system
MRVVLDTNVVVSGLLNAAGKPGKVIDLALDDRFQIAYDDRILGEYEDVLARPELHIRPADARAFITHVEVSGCLVEEAAPFPPDGFPDPDDLPFVEVLVTSNAAALVTGNLRHFAPLLERKMAVFTPAQFLERFFPEEG